IEAVLLGSVRGGEAGAGFVVERSDHRPVADRSDLVEEGGRTRELPLGDRQLGAHLRRERPHVGPRLRLPCHALEHDGQRPQVALLIPALVQPEEVRDGLRPVQLAQQPCLQRGRTLLEGSSGRDGDCGGEDEAEHAFGLPRGEQEIAHPPRSNGGWGPPIPPTPGYAVTRQARGRQPPGRAGAGCYGARASVRTSTRAAPASSRAPAAADAVAPVVRTSSTRQTRAPSTVPAAAKAPRTLRSRPVRS